MQLTWYGKSCFLLKTNTGKNILFDPIEYVNDCFDKIPKFNIMTLSHAHFNTNYSTSSYNNCTIIDTPGIFNLDNILIEGFCSYRDNFKGLKRGRNIIYVITVDKIRICHLGHIGHLLDKTLLDKLSNIDVLLIPIDYNFFLSGNVAAKLSSILLPKFIIPMNFSTDSCTYWSNDFREFLSFMNSVKKINSSSVDLCTLNYNMYYQCLILNAANIHSNY